MADAIIIHLEGSEYDKLVSIIKPELRFSISSIEEENIILPMSMINSENQVVFVRKHG